MVDALALKDYQIKVLDTVEKYLDVLQRQYARVQRNYERDLDDGEDAIHPDSSNYCVDAWTKLKAILALPRNTIKGGLLSENDWRNRRDGMERAIPNICLKVPTGGGKTLLAACALQRINHDYFKLNTGLVLWIMPSTTIYSQTSKALRNKEHPYRRQLDIASGGRTKILERGDNFDIQDVQNYLCVMLLTLQSFNVAKKSKDARKIYGDSGQYASFFPVEDDELAKEALLAKVKNLLEEDLEERTKIQGIHIKQSLGNVFRLMRPIVIIDEEHKAKTLKAIENINQFNPKFILELSATPRYESNKLVDVGGQDLKQEQMIKLPINVKTIEKAEWKITLEQAHAKLNELAKDAAKLENKEGTYIRPIMVIIAQPKNKNDDYNHVAEIKKYLIDKCQVQETQIRIKLSEEDGLKDDDLLDKMCGVKYIITKDALREGWDCPFAYILTILTNKNSAIALTQYTGRVLRQPYAQTTSIAALNECYIYCNEANVVDAVTKIKAGLEQEGLGDIASQINAMNEAASTPLLERVTLSRNSQFQNKIFLPRLNSVLPCGNVQAFDYYRDILGEVNWGDYVCDEKIVLSSHVAIYQHGRKIDSAYDLHGKQRFLDYGDDRQAIQFETQINFGLLTSLLTDKIPNPFEARRIIGEVVEKLKKEEKEEKQIAVLGHDIVRQIKDHAFKWLLSKSEALFKSKLEAGLIKLHLQASSDLNWDLGEIRDVLKTQHDIDNRWEKNIFQPQYASHYNNLEKDVAAYINAHEAIKWWHRLGVKGTEYAVQGWTPAKIYPDFLVFQHNGKYAFIETKGIHLKNEDSIYKGKLFEALNTANLASIGSFDIKDAKMDISFNLVYQNEWKEEVIKIFEPAI